MPTKGYIYVNDCLLSGVRAAQQRAGLLEMKLVALISNTQRHEIHREFVLVGSKLGERSIPMMYTQIIKLTNIRTAPQSFSICLCCLANLEVVKPL